MTLSLTNPVENLLKVTLLKFEEGEKETNTESGGQEKNKQDQSAEKTDDNKVDEEKKDDKEENKEDGEKGKDEKKGEQEGKEKPTEVKKKDTSVAVTTSKKPDRCMDNRCESRSFVPSAEVNAPAKANLFPVLFDQYTCYILNL